MWTTWTAFRDILSKLTPFKTLVFNIGIDSFQDPCSDYFNKTSEIDSFQDPCVLHQNWLLSRPCTATYMAKHHKLTPFKTLTFYIGIDSFQDPKCFGHKSTNLNTPGSELSQSQPNSVISRPSYWIYTVFQSPWETTCKLSMGDYLHELSSKPSTKWILDLFVKTRRKRHHMHLVNSVQDASLARPAFGAAGFAKTHSFQDPKNLTSTVHSSTNTVSLTPTQDKDIVTVHIAHLYILIIDFKLLKSIFHYFTSPRDMFRLPKST